MKKTDLITKITAALVFLALACYLGVYFWRSVKDPVVTAPAMLTTVRSETPVSGIVVRSESLLRSDAAYMGLRISDGKRVAKNSAVAVTYDSEEAVQRAERIRELELEIAQAESVLSGLVSADELTERNTAIETAARELSAAVARHELTEAELHSLNLRTLLFENGAQSVSAGDLIVLRSELEKLQANAYSDMEPITAPAAGIFSTMLDGYEHLQPSDLKNLTPEKLRSIMDEPQEKPADAFGKLVDSTRWYFAAVIDAEHLEVHGSAIAKGDFVTLEFGRYYSQNLRARVESIGAPADGGCVIVFSCSEALADTLAMRIVTATLVMDEHSGIRVPKEAVRMETNDAGEIVRYVYTLTGAQAEKKTIEIVWETENYYLVAESGQDRALREGNEIIVSANDLYDGKIME